MEWVCKQCSKKLKNKNPTSKNTLNYDWYYFCSQDCINKYIQEQESKCECGDSKSIHTIDEGNCKYCNCKKFVLAKNNDINPKQEVVEEKSK